MRDGMGECTILSFPADLIGKGSCRQRRAAAGAIQPRSRMTIRISDHIHRPLPNNCICAATLRQCRIMGFNQGTEWAEIIGRSRPPYGFQRARTAPFRFFCRFLSWTFIVDTQLKYQAINFALAEMNGFSAQTSRIHARYSWPTPLDRANPAPSPAFWWATAR